MGSKTEHMAFYPIITQKMRIDNLSKQVEKQSLSLFYYYSHRHSPLLHGFGRPEILRFVSYSTLEKSPLSKVVKDKVERSRPIWGVGRLYLFYDRVVVTLPTW